MEEIGDTTELGTSARGPGRPPARRREKFPGRMVYIPDDLWNVALEQDGGASVFIRRLLREYQEREARDTQENRSENEQT